MPAKYTVYVHHTPFCIVSCFKDYRYTQDNGIPSFLILPEIRAITG